MRVFSEREQVMSVAKRWAEHYPLRDEPGGVLDRLRALDPTSASAADVAAIIGNDSWVSPQECDECGHRGWDVVELGQEPDYESNTACVCSACLRRALGLATGATGE